MNTVINYLYRDAGNYKIFSEIIVKGEISLEEKAIILDSLDSGEFFIPSVVGLPEKRFEDFDPLADHPWFELPRDFAAISRRSSDFVMDIHELTKAFARAKGKWETLYGQGRMED